ncbi:MAG: transposase [Bacteroidales bacterium]|nr:transposase [Candidatus Sodaliphilus fimicaballi]
MMSFTQSIYHVVFRTKGSQCNLNFENERLLYNYIYSTSINLGCHVYRIGGMPDHIHICVGLPPSLSIAKYAEVVKVSATKRFKQSAEFPYFLGWSKGYAAFSISYDSVDDVVEYIKGQKVHHQSFGFANEYIRLVKDAGINVTEEILFKD